MKTFLYFLSIIFLLTSLNACKIFRSPRIKSSGYIQGISAKYPKYYKSNQFLIIHGIGAQKNDYSEKLIRRLNNYHFGTNNYQYEIWTYENKEFQKQNTTDYCAVLDKYCNHGDIEIMKIKAHSLDSERNDTNLFYSINWSVLIENNRNELKNSEIGGKPLYRGLNRFAKRKILIDKVSDAFSGSKTGTLTPLVTAFIKILEDEKMLEKDKLNLISGSFGSQLFLATLLALQDDSFHINDFIDKDEQTIFMQEDGFKLDINTEIELNMFMLTNQLNLMPENVIDWANSICNDSLNKSTRLNFNKVNVTAFRNPNDLLCYYVPKKALKNIFSVDDSDIHLVNAYYFNWPIRNDAMLAHTSVFKLKKLSKIIYYGSESNWTKLKKGYK
ncbi:MAG: hypothetical protein ACWA41_07280 [Putridiphycobacter sp.]